jgi:signal transduction histidine kinase
MRAGSGHVRDSGLLRRVRWRLVAWSAGSTLLLLVTLGTALYLSVNASLSASGTSQLEQRAAVLMSVLRGQPPGPALDGSDDSPFGRPILGGPASGTLAIVVGAQGQIVGPRPQDTTDLPITQGVDTALERARDLRDATIGGTPVRVLSESVSVDGDPYVVQVIQDRSAEVRTLNALLTMLVAGGLAVLAVATAFGFLYAGRALAPIRESLRRQREFAADASHELRTPLTVLQTSLEYLLRHPEKRVKEATDITDGMRGGIGHLTTIVDDLLLLARSDSGVVNLRSEPVDLSDVAGDALQSLATLAAERIIALRLDAAPVLVEGDPQRLRQLVAILVDNAISHSPSGSTVRVTVAADSSARLFVEDEGAGIRDEDLPHVFDRFWRATDAPSGGTGLGLSIAQWIAEHHRGSIEASNRPEGGAKFELRLPRRQLPHGRIP